MSMEERRSARRAILAGLIAVASGVGAPVGAQSPLELRVGVFGAVLDGRGGLPSAPLLESPVNVVSYEQFDVAPAVGAVVELGMQGWPASLRVRGARSFAADEVGTWGCTPDVGCPSILILIPTEIRTTHVSADIVAELPVGAGALRPFVGLGVLRQSFRWDPSDAGSFSLEPGEHTDQELALHLGVGAAIPVGSVELDGGWALVGAREHATGLSRFGTGWLGVTLGL